MIKIIESTLLMAGVIGMGLFVRKVLRMEKEIHDVAKKESDDVEEQKNTNELQMRWNMSANRAMTSIANRVAEIDGAQCAS